MTAKKTVVDFNGLQKELDDISVWFENNTEIDPSIALEKYRRSVEIVTFMKSYLSEVENEFKAINAELEND